MGTQLFEIMGGTNLGEQKTSSNPKLSSVCSQPEDYSVVKLKVSSDTFILMFAEMASIRSGLAGLVKFSC